MMMTRGGPERPLFRSAPRIRRPFRASAVLLALSLAGCGGVGTSVKPPSQGTIVLHSPAKTSRGVKLAATTIMFTTATDDPEGQPDQGVQVTVGTLQGHAPPVRSVTQLAKGTNAPATRILDTASFAALWRNMEAAGLFRLPRYPGGRVPEDQQYILVKSDGDRRIYTQPPPATSLDDEATAKRLMQYWRDSKLAIVSFLNS